MSSVSPELALVDPELRALAIRILPRVSPYAFLEPRPEPVVPLGVTARPSRLTATAAYLVVAIARTLAVNLAVFAGIAAFVLIVNFFA